MVIEEDDPEYKEFSKILDDAKKNKRNVVDEPEDDGENISFFQKKKKEYGVTTWAFGPNRKGEFVPKK